ncbi:MAG: oligosaccharide flippase family protein [Caldilineaceae bacterium]
MLETQPTPQLNELTLAERLRVFFHRATANNLLASSALFFVSTTIVNGGNYLFNLLLGRWLGPALFADVSIIITLFLLLTFLTTGLQQTAAKFAAVYSAEKAPDRLWALRHWLNRRAWLAGAFCVLILGGGARFWQDFFHTTSPWLFVIFGVGLPFYFAQGIDRGILQGQTRFLSLAISYQAEMWVRLLLGLLLVMLGWAAYGAVFALTLSIVTTWLVSQQALHPLESDSTSLKPANLSRFSQAEQKALLAFAVPVLMSEISLILINNSDVIIVKHFFTSVAAGQYAALALIGRIVFFGTWSVVITMFPLVAQKAHRGEPHHHLLWSGLGMVVGVSTMIVLATLFFPAFIVRLLFGAEYVAIAPLLWVYAVATALFALANVVINYRLALEDRVGTVWAFAAGLLQVGLLLLFHTSLFQVVFIQVILMGLLLLLLLGREGMLRTEK